MKEIEKRGEVGVRMGRHREVTRRMPSHDSRPSLLPAAQMSDEEWVASMVEETRMMARVASTRHDHLLDVLGWVPPSRREGGGASGSGELLPALIVMPVAEGGNVADLLRSSREGGPRAPLTRAERVRLFLEAVLGVAEVGGSAVGVDPSRSSLTPLLAPTAAHAV